MNVHGFTEAFEHTMPLLVTGFDVVLQAHVPVLRPLLAK